MVSWLDRSASNSNNLRGAWGIAIAFPAVTSAVNVVGAFIFAYNMATLVGNARSSIVPLRCRHCYREILS
jgi:hypothetical protein